VYNGWCNICGDSCQDCRNFTTTRCF
jgi:hypothetical protein